MPEPEQKTEQQTTTDGADDTRSRKDDRLDTLLEERKAERAEMAQMKEKLAYLEGQNSVKPKPTTPTGPQAPDFSKIDDPDERRDALIAYQAAKLEALEKQREADQAERAHANLVSRAKGRLSFGEDEQDQQDADEAISAYARTHDEQQTRAYAQRLSARFTGRKPDKQPSPADEKAAKDKEYVDRKLADKRQTDRPEGVSTPPERKVPAGGERLNPRSKVSKEDARKAFFQAMAAEAEAGEA